MGVQKLLVQSTRDQSEAKRFESLQKALWWILYEGTWVFSSSWFNLSVIGGETISSLQKALRWILYEETRVFWSSWINLRMIGGKTIFIVTESSELNSVRRNMGVLKLLVQCQRDLRQNNFNLSRTLRDEFCTKKHGCFETAGSMSAWSEAKQFQSLQKALWWVLYEVTLVFWSSWFYLSVIWGKTIFIPSECSEMNSVRRNMGVLKLVV